MKQNNRINPVKEIIKKSLNDKGQSKFENFIKSNNKFLIGKNIDSENAAKLFQFSGIIDDNSKHPTIWNNLPVFNTSSIPKDSWVLNCVTSISPVDVIKKLNEHGIVNIINCCDFWEKDSRIKLEIPWFIEQQRADCDINLKEWSDLYEILDDAESKETLLDTIAFRLTGNPIHMNKYAVRTKDQYFESFLNLDQEVFVDCGGFDGDSTEIFCEKYPNYKKVFFFEPSPANLKAAKKRLKRFLRIDYLPLGLSDEDGRLNFEPSAGSASSVQSTSEHSIDVCKLDSIIKEHITFLKMDIEGWETHALDGCMNTIKKYSPKIAVAVYHSSSDFWKIYKKIKYFQPQYKVRLRHYTQGWSETVMYFSLS